MLCENCGERRAEVHFVRVVNGERREEHICRECAETMLPFSEAANMMKMSFSMEGIMNIEEALKSMLLPMIPEIYGLDDREVRCPHCGETLDADDVMHMFADDFRQEGSAGDAGEILPGSVTFDEKTPKRREAYRDRLFKKDERVQIVHPPKEEAPQADPAQRELAGLKKELELVLRGERYERAAQIRDRICELEKNLTEK